MDEKKQNEIILELLGWSEVRLDAEKCFVSYTEGGALRFATWFTRSHENLHLMRAALIERELDAAFIRELGKVCGIGGDWLSSGKPRHWAIDLMQAAPAQQVEAAVRALGLWKEAAST